MKGRNDFGIGIIQTSEEEKYKSKKQADLVRIINLFT